MRIVPAIDRYGSKNGRGHFFCASRRDRFEPAGPPLAASCPGKPPAAFAVLMAPDRRSYGSAAGSKDRLMADRAETSDSRFRWPRRVISSRTCSRRTRRIYWADFLLSTIGGMVCFGLVRRGCRVFDPNRSWCSSFAAAVLPSRPCCSRTSWCTCARSRFGLFRVVWNLLIGIPFLMPTFVLLHARRPPHAKAFWHQAGRRVPAAGHDVALAHRAVSCASRWWFRSLPWCDF